MALIECPECGKKVSDRAAACPDCGFPLAQRISTVNTQTIEKTAKKYKFISLISILMILVGIATVYAGSINPQGSNSVFYGAFLTLLGFGIYLANRVFVWWHHD